MLNEWLLEKVALDEVSEADIEPIGGWVSGNDYGGTRPRTVVGGSAG
jgi:hypothetical protein